MPPIAHRTELLARNPFRRIAEQAATLQNPINLGMGQPDFDVPEPLKAVAIDAIRAGHNGYSQAAGYQPLRQAIQTTLDAQSRQTGREVVITCGTLGALTLALQAIINPGDEVILFDPYFLAYPHLVHLVGGTSVFLSTYPDFQPDPERVREAITPRTRAILLCSPSNPTGVVATAERVKALVELADRHGIWLISDEIYSTFVYDVGFISPIGFGENVIVCSSFSKTHGMPGWRLGYSYGPREVIQAMMSLQQATFVCAPTMAQHAGVAAWTFPMDGYVEIYRRRRDWLLANLDPLYKIVKPDGAFYLFPQAPHGTGTDWAEAALRQNLIFMPGSVFSLQDSHFRLSYAAHDETLERAVTVLNRMV
jgi:aspartate/methionine/tyrosine aminotransferase